MTKQGSQVARSPMYWPVVFFRIFWAAAFIFFINAVLPLGTTPWLVASAAGLGVIVASKVAHTRLTTTGLTSGIAAIFFTLWAIFRLTSSLLVSSKGHQFVIDSIELHIDTCLLGFAAGAVSTWLFWRARAAVTIEAMALAAICIIVFAGHRNFHLDRPKILNSLAWRFGVDHLTMLMVVGSALLAASVSYLVIASQVHRPNRSRGPIQRSSNSRSVVLSTVFVGILAALVYWIQTILYAHLYGLMMVQVANGVGMGSESNASPLTFQSALGSTNQPAALVRLEGDYPNNPYSPMMYLRESALSGFNGREMVFSGRAYDSDLPVIRPTDTFTGKEDPELTSRTPVVQSFYLLADHDNAFALDYPISIVGLKNPKPNRFKAAYRAYSVAPSFPMSDLRSGDIGDPRWTPDVLQHYLKQHPDSRYKDLALKVTADAEKPIEKVLAITNYLSRTAIYTLTPNHEVKPDEDPVAPFLFGDHRGYCVHFAHAIVFMARALGIPARVGTGYLTDLSQAKDGHILLRMSDRHAWAEVYVTGYGWMPFDVQPDQVESHADTQVDPKLLEELMGMLEPPEELLPSEQTKDEPGMSDPDEVWMPDSATVAKVAKVVAAVGIAIYVIAFVVLFFAWRVVSSPRLKLKLAYYSLVARLYNTGHRRRYGETREEFAGRVAPGILGSLTALVLTYAYGEKHSASLTSSHVTPAVDSAFKAYGQYPRWRRALALINPAAVIRFIGGRRW